MSMPIQRQSEAFGIFDDGPRFARDRSSTDLPRGLAGLVNSMGPRIQAGLLNTRTAVNTDHMDPDSHAYHQDSYGGPYDAGGHWVGDEDGYRSPRREWNPDFGYEMTDEDIRNHEGVAEDDDSGYNWGPEPTGIPEHLVHGQRIVAEYDEDEDEDEVPSRRDQWNQRREQEIRMTRELFPDRPAQVPRSLRELMKGRQASRGSDRRPFDRAAAARLAAEHRIEDFAGSGRPVTNPYTGDDEGDFDGDPKGRGHWSKDKEAFRLAKDSECTCWEGYERVPGTEPCADDSCRKESMLIEAGQGVDYRNVRPGPLVDSPLYEQDPDDYFGWRPYSGPHCPDCGKPMPWVSGPNCRHGKLLPRLAQDPAAMAPQMPVGGGFMPAHRVGLDWRDSTVPGTVIGVDDRVHVRWDDGQYTSEDPTEVHLL